MRIIQPATAFSLSRGKKRPRITSASHLAFIQSLPCLATGIRNDIEAAHIRYGDPRYGKREVGKGEKPDDKYTVPLHWREHRLQHESGESWYWKAAGIDPVAVAIALWSVSGDHEAAELILRSARKC